MGGIKIRLSLPPKPLRRWQFTQATSMPLIRSLPSRRARRGFPDGSQPPKVIRLPIGRLRLSGPCQWLSGKCQQGGEQ